MAGDATVFVIDVVFQPFDDAVLLDAVAWAFARTRLKRGRNLEASR